MGEVTAAAAEIRWTVHLANAKAAWYDFDIALDVPSARGLPPAPLQDAPPPTRLKWLRTLPGFGVSSEQRINAFIRQWHGAGVVTRQPGPADGAPFPEAFWVEMGYALVDDTALFPQPDPPVDPTAGDLAGPVNAPLPEPDS